MMKFERVAVPEHPLRVTQIGPDGLMVVNTGTTELLVGIEDDLMTADNTIAIAPGATITWPWAAPDGLYARSTSGVGEISYPVFSYY
jgi:hypothetical protein